MTGWESGGNGPADLGLPSLGLPENDFDLIADYLAGALHDAEAEAEAARRIRDDPAWREVSAQLERSSAQVSADLAVLGRLAEPMPGDVAERIEAALAAQVPGVETPVSADQRTHLADRLVHLADKPAAQRGSKVRARLRSARWSARRSAPLAVAAALLTFLGFGLWVSPHFNSETAQTMNDSGAGAPQFTNGDAPARGGAGKESLGGIPVRRLIATGTDYRRDTVLVAGRAEAPAPAVDNPTDGPATVLSASGVTADDVAAELRRLTDVTALTSCLAAITGTHPYPIAAIELVDFASFEGSAALVVVVTDTTGARWAWAAGPGCGLPGVGAQARFRAKVG